MTAAAVTTSLKIAEEASRCAAEERARREAEERRRREAEERRRRQTPIWHQIGIEMVTIPAGEFLYGDDKNRIYLPEYRLAKTTVTNTQYKAFVDATGHDAPEHWEGGRIPSGKQYHPVVYVNWEDSQAFCRWAGCRLPTEQEWEKGARGTDGREYPWGDKWRNGRCNSGEMRIDDTISVDRYPGGSSPHGVLDMAGNVWEWCEDWYDNDSRVVRGGSFHSLQWFVRCAFRYNRDPSYRDLNLGFRCVVAPIA